MHSFTDNAARSWAIEINVAQVRKLRGGQLKLDLVGLVDNGAKGLAELMGDPIRFVDMLWFLCEGQAVERQVSDEEFGRSMAGDAIGHAADAFMEALIDFFPEAKARENLRRMMDKARTLGNLIMEQSAKKIDSLDPALIAEKLTSSLTSAPESSASTQAHSLSANSAA